MKLYLLILLTIAISIADIRPASAQATKSLVALSWEFSFPSNNNYLTESSARGGRLEYRMFVQPNLSVGLGLSWNSFDQYIPSQTYKNLSGNTAVTTDMVRQIYTLPITITGHYYFQTGNPKLRPYVGVGVGAQYAEQNSYFNVYGLENKNWGFVARPEIGGLFRVGQDFSILLAGSYNIATNKNDEFNISSLKQWGINLGGALHF
jgi:outer membrane protein W